MFALYIAYAILFALWVLTLVFVLQYLMFRYVVMTCQKPTRANDNFFNYAHVKRYSSVSDVLV